ncbi:hypothetical protein IQ06DRAFT_107238 [Phaeosphaeriaceae sp. SRC1lsM3a]|nr:hypothetical protein IQ06DRAFT_107238 [Stagonospora sp. SRC1lsM3a]
MLISQHSAAPSQLRRASQYCCAAAVQADVVPPCPAGSHGLPHRFAHGPPSISMHRSGAQMLRFAVGEPTQGQLCRASPPADTIGRISSIICAHPCYQHARSLPRSRQLVRDSYWLVPVELAAVLSVSWRISSRSSWNDLAGLPYPWLPQQIVGAFHHAFLRNALQRTVAPPNAIVIVCAIFTALHLGMHPSL